MNWTDEQLAALCAKEPRFIITAAAGSGKTRVLTERYLQLVADGTSPDHILAITYSRKAAAEMKRRIVDGLRAARKFEEAQIAETGPVQTVHSFCERILRENCLAAGLPPDFEVWDDQKSGPAKRLAVDRAILSPTAETAEVVRFIRDLGGTTSWSPTGMNDLLTTEVQEVMKFLRESVLGLDEFSRRYGSAESTLATWCGFICRHLEIENPGVLDAESVDRIRKVLTHRGDKTRSKSLDGFDASRELTAAFHTSGLVQLGIAASVNYTSMMHAANGVDFLDMLRRTSELLRRVPSVGDRLRRQYRFVMVDESQDINAIQDDLLASLDIPNEMRVGDPQQTIYSFQGADRGAFMRHTEARPVFPLRANKRSPAGMLRVVDHIFSRIWQDEYQPMHVDPPPSTLEEDAVETPMGHVTLWRYDSTNWDQVAGYIERLRDAGERLRDTTLLVRDGFQAGYLRTALLKRGLPARIAGGSENFYTRLEIRDLANLLEALSNPHDDVRLLAVLRGPAALFSLDAVALLANGGDVWARLADFVSPVAADHDARDRFLAWFRPLAMESDRMAAWEVITEVFRVSPFLPTLARRPRRDQTIANARKLLSMASAQPEESAVGFARRIFEMQSLRSKEGEAAADAETADVLQIMTIHKSKGLEFPNVIFLDSGKELVKKAKSLRVMASEGMIVYQAEPAPVTLAKLVDQVRRADAGQEELRVLYVALTRATRHLYIAFPTRPGQNTFGSHLQRALAGLDLESWTPAKSESPAI